MAGPPYDQPLMDHDLTTLPNGLRVITETMPSVRSVAVGCWVDTGSRDETPIEAGCSHFLERLQKPRLESRPAGDRFVEPDHSRR